MFSLDDRAGNVVTTVALFVVAATILYMARGAFLILLLSLVPIVAVLRIVWLECLSAQNFSTALSDQPLVRVKP
jgi:hypothetical protein